MQAHWKINMKTILNLLLLLIIPIQLNAQSFYTESGTAEFTSKVPLHTFTGTSENLVGMIDLEKKIIDFYLDLTTLDTGNGKRDKDMRITLETDKYPFAEFYGQLTSTFDLDSDDEQSVVVSGTFKIHGKQQEISVEGTLQKIGDDLKLKADWILNLNDYEIVPPKLLIIKVDEEQEIEIEALLKPYTGNDEK